MRIKFRHLDSTLDVLSEPEDNPAYIDDAILQEAIHALSIRIEELTAAGHLHEDDVIVEII